MKRMLGLALLCAAGVSYISATHEKVSDLIDFAHEIKGKTVQIPGELAKKWHNYMALELKMHAHHARKIAEQLKPEQRTKYEKVARRLSLAAEEVAALPTADFEKTFDHPGKMLAFKAIEAELMGEKVANIGRQLDKPMLVEKGEKMEKWGQDLKAALKAEFKSSYCPAMTENEGQEEAIIREEGQEDVYEGCDEGGDTSDKDEVSMEEKVSHLVDFAKAIKGKTVEVPGELARKFHKFMAAKLKMHAHHARKIAEQLNPEDRNKYERVARKLSLAAEQVAALPVVDFKETFDHPAGMLALKAMKAKLIGEKLDNIGQQLDKPMLVEKGEKIEKWGEDLEEALKKEFKSAYCPAEDEGSNEGHEDMDVYEGGEYDGGEAATPASPEESEEEEIEEVEEAPAA